MTPDLLRMAFAVAWLVSPLFFYVPLAEHAGPAFFLGLFGIAAAILCIPSLWANSARAVLLSLAPVALLSGFVSAYLFFYKTPITVGLLQSVLHTDPREFVEQARRYAAVAALCVTGTLAYLGCVLSMRRGIALRRRGILVASSLWAVLVALYQPYLGFETYQRFGRSMDLSFVRESYPLNLLFIGRDFYEAMGLRSFQDDVDDSEVMPARVARGLGGSERQVFVLVVGESARAQTWSELSSGAEDPRLVAMDDALAQANFSWASVPMLVSGARRLADARRLPTIIEWQRAAGCKTAVVSNNSSFRFAKRADIRVVKGDAGIVHRVDYDHDLLPIVRSLVENGALRKLCIVVHMAGSHQDYRERYPDRFARFPTDAVPAEVALRNAYRNSILASQDFLRALITLLSREDESVFLAFTSDHGENLLEINGLREHATLTPTEFELRVPMIFWASRAFSLAQAEKWRQLGANSRTPVSTGQIVPTMLDAMGIWEDASAAYGFGASLMRPVRGEARRYVTPDLREHAESDMLRAAR